VRAVITKAGGLRNLEVLQGDPLLVPAVLTAVKTSLLAAGLAHFARGLLFGLDGIVVELQALVALTLLAIGLMALYPPARRATRVDPLVALPHQ
jgi:hypothetical protein